MSLDGRELYHIASFDELDPFLMTLASDSDLWMYVSSRGGLAAGRHSADRALFSYETDDRLHHLYGVTGPFTLIRVAQEDESDLIWEPFGPVATDPAIRRNLYKNVLCNQLTFEEINPSLGLTFRYCWQNCNELGFVRTCTLINHSPAAARSIDLLDGLLNIQPAGAPLTLHQTSSCLIDAYKCCEVDRESKLAIYSMNALVSDRPEPAECLRASIAWCRGLDDYRIALSDRQIRNFRLHQPIRAENSLRGARGHFLAAASIRLRAGQAMSWDLVADTHVAQGKVAQVRRFLMDSPRPHQEIRDRIAAGSQNLRRIVAAADGIQAGADPIIAGHHFANVLFNVMRGGVVTDNGCVRRDDLVAFVRSRNRPVAARHAELLSALPERMEPHQLLVALDGANDPHLVRLGYEFLPITFARRHGDPSRPWNRFAIAAPKADGSPSIDYAGNWRDIFQNWEALGLSFPAYLVHMVARFANASTPDGFNPYRIGSEGIDWEEPRPEDASANIGYWGDHQIVYLTRLLRLLHDHDPDVLPGLMRRSVFSYADVPYRLKPFEVLLRNPRESIEFDRARARSVQARLDAIGGDGRLVHDQAGAIVLTNLCEKLLVGVLARLGSFLPGGGVWMNTQRPEWNDANNALAGHGLSIVTTCYLRKHLKFLIELLESCGGDPISLHAPVARWLEKTADAMALPDEHKFTSLNTAFCDYRKALYQHGFVADAAREAVAVETVIGLLRSAVAMVDRTIRSNRRPDGLYHSYNLLHTTDLGIERLPEMLEGQVAAISSGLLAPDECAQVIQALFDSALYRDEQRSFMLYPDREAIGFLAKNRLPADAVKTIELLNRLLAGGDERLIIRDADGVCRFAADLHNHRELQSVLAQIGSEADFADCVPRDSSAVANLFESVFHHHAFTGRSGSMFGYEGLGCVYWHMVAKLLVALQEQVHCAFDAGEDPAVLDRLIRAYRQVRDGLGFNKSPREYGAFPTDPYSHTPGTGGARQPGMTGQVKEEIITRFGELGVRIAAGRIRFSPVLLCASEFCQTSMQFEYVDRAGTARATTLPPGSLAFTFCQTPVIYRLDEEGPRILIVRSAGRHEVVAGDTIDEQTSAAIFGRQHNIERIEVSIPPGTLPHNREGQCSFRRAASPPAVSGLSVESKRESSINMPRRA